MPAWDFAALALFCLMWLGYEPAIGLAGVHSINTGMRSVRVAWMASLLRRDNRITDSTLIGHVMHSTSFFASTSLIAIGALISALGGLDRVQPAVEALGFVPPVPRMLFTIKVALVLAVLVHGFFRLTWAIRQINYTIALVGAAPAASALGDQVSDLAEALGGMLTAALVTFNDGIRSYYFALAALAWLLGPLALALASLLLTAVMVWRQLGSPVATQFQHAAALTLRAHARLKE
ncbi:conserved membrane protein of unknown function [Rhodovastum atsumiense]|uniref:DUF599 family protein n=1 Tax=Rhodovastum atsumiense TaxID=504468 RepID=A0A5M6IIJ2_9PROT|nr:DUF599 family protein [Rhodovastum atsumiense]KAA5608096.1 DUF599 family protein [Rhodovastum atsumiense]CAH2604897.1 conserved membrane protein of unknown function [Rhodovastum atsumiense]